MRMSQLFGKTLRQAPVEAEVESHKLLVRAGYIRQIGAGIYSYLPLGWRVIRKIEAILRDEMDGIGGQEVLMPLLNPGELWKESGRWYAIGPELVRFQDRGGRDFALAMTHEEVVTDLARREIRSYRQLPVMLYQIQTKVRDEARPRGGLIRVREFLMKDGYSFHTDAEDLDAYYPRVYDAYVRIFRRCGVEAVPVEADTGLIGGTGSHEFIQVTPVGEDTIIRCPGCGYAANAEKAVARKPRAEDTSDHGTDETKIAAKDVPSSELVHTPGAKTIEALTAFFDLPHAAFLKSVFYYSAGPAVAEDAPRQPELIIAALQGDLDVNEAKLARAVGRGDLRLANDEELRAAGIVAGFASPACVEHGAIVGGLRIRIVVDDNVPGQAFVAGGNRVDYHARNVVFGRDFAGEVVADIALAAPGHRCANCGAELQADRGIELGHTFKLGTKYSVAMQANYLDAGGQQNAIVMGCYGIGLGRLLAAVVEQHHDDHGIVWPAVIAPYQVYLCGIGLDSPEVLAAATKLEQELRAAGLEVLFDDRAEAPGVKFNDADLIGLPVRVVVSPRTLKAAAAEVRARGWKQAENVPSEQVVARVKAMLAESAAALA